MANRSVASAATELNTTSSPKDRYNNGQCGNDNTFTCENEKTTKNISEEGSEDIATQMDSEEHRGVNEGQHDELVTPVNGESDRTRDGGQLQIAYPQSPKQYESEKDEQDNTSILSTGSVVYDDGDDEEQATDPAIIDELELFQNTFKGIARHFRLINKIGEGTFSSVYKAEDLNYEHYENAWDFESGDEIRQSPPALKRRRVQMNEVVHGQGNRRPKYVAIKKIYVTSSPARIQNELELLHDLSGCDTVVPLITAFRYHDQVVAILPYFKHVDFREYFRSLTINEVRFYFKSLFGALAHVHAHNIIHRDIKPTYVYAKKTSRISKAIPDSLVDEREGTESSFCNCQLSPNEGKERRISTPTTTSQGYPKNDPRPSRRANRAGTRGFRAPEVLFKCTNQTTKIDIWSAGVILLTMLSRRFPFFNSSDDVDALIEIATIFGKHKMRQCAVLHGCVFETTIPTIGEKGFTLEKIVLWATNRTSSGSSADRDDDVLPRDEAMAVKFMQLCFELDPARRISAQEALQHGFLTAATKEEDLDSD